MVVIKGKANASHAGLSGDNKALSYLQKMFPWFKSDELKEVMRSKGESMEHVIAELERRSGKPENQTDDEF